MVTSIDEAAANFRAGIAGCGARYDAKVATMPGNWAAALSAIGVTVGPITSAKYSKNIAGKGAKLEANATRGADKWLANYRAGMAI